MAVLGGAAGAPVAWLWWDEIPQAPSLVLISIAAALLACTIWRVHWSHVCFIHGAIMLCSSLCLGVGTVPSDWANKPLIDKLGSCFTLAVLVLGMGVIVFLCLVILLSNTTR